MAARLVSPAEAVVPIGEGARVMIGGFGVVGCPFTLVRALRDQGTRRLTVISNSLGDPGRGNDELLQNDQVARAIGSYFTSNPAVLEAQRAGRLEVELLPQGTFAESMRAAGAGLGGFYTPTGVGTALAGDREVRHFGDRDYLLVEPLRADVALVRAHLADELGNLVYYKTARNFNPLMAAAAEYVVAEVDEILPIGALDPERIVTPHLYVEALVLADPAVSPPFGSLE